MCSMREGTVIPQAMIPARAWGLAWEAYDREEIAARDPFGGSGMRLEIPAGIVTDTDEIAVTVGAGHVVLFDGLCAWVDGCAAPEEVHGRWAGWLAAKGPSLLG